jgi:SAM-dependent methyltransferase
METCTKAVRTSLLQSDSDPQPRFPHRARADVQAREARRAHLRGADQLRRPHLRGRQEDRLRDGFLALGAMVHWWLEDDLYKPTSTARTSSVSLANVPHFNRWMGDVLRPYLGTRVLEIGAGIGNLTRRFTPRDAYTATDINPHYIDYLRRTLADGRTSTCASATRPTRATSRSCAAATTRSCA